MEGGRRCVQSLIFMFSDSFDAQGVCKHPDPHDPILLKLPLGSSPLHSALFPLHIAQCTLTAAFSTASS
eukprot:1158634-Pelagomonas_calceolata.AAC.2